MASQSVINLKAFVVAALRRASYSWPPRSQAKSAARVSRGFYACALCKKKTFTSKEIQVDHIEPVVSITDSSFTWDKFISRLLVPKEQLQVLCRPCHKAKTKEENAERRKNKVK